LNRAIIRRLINDYLDGEIGLADKAELERLMVENPEIRQEYRELRRLSLHLNSMPEITVHPSRFRAKVLSAIDDRERLYFTPQRAFAGAMLVMFLVVGTMFGLMLVQLWYNTYMETGEPANTVVADEHDYHVTLNVTATPEKFFNRLLQEYRVGYDNYRICDVFVQETNVFARARCLTNGGLESVEFPSNLPKTIKVNVTPNQVVALGRFTEGLTGVPSLDCLSTHDGRIADITTLHEIGSRSGYIRVKLTFK